MIIVAALVVVAADVEIKEKAYLERKGRTGVLNESYSNLGATGTNGNFL